MVGNDNMDAGFNGTGQELIFQNKSSLSISHSHEHEHEVSVGTSTHTSTHTHEYQQEDEPHGSSTSVIFDIGINKSTKLSAEQPTVA